MHVFHMVGKMDVCPKFTQTPVGAEGRISCIGDGWNYHCSGKNNGKGGYIGLMAVFRCIGKVFPYKECEDFNPSRVTQSV